MIRKIEIDISGQIQQLNYDSALDNETPCEPSEFKLGDERLEHELPLRTPCVSTQGSSRFRRDNGLEKSVFLRSKDKKEIIRKYKGQVTDLIEKLHCIMIYYCIKDELGNINEIKICRDVNFRRVRRLLPLLFKESNYLGDINIIVRKGKEKISSAHNIALRTFRRQKYAALIITKEMIEDVLFQFKKK